MHRLIAFLPLFSYSLLAQAQISRNWQNMDLEKDSVFGISTEKAYNEFLKNKKVRPVIAAIIDSGIDTAHEDLESVLWTCQSDGSHGRSYMDCESGKEDITQLADAKKAFYDSLSYTRVPEIYKTEYKTYRIIKEDYKTHIRNLEMFIAQLRASEKVLEQIVQYIGKDSLTIENFKSYKPRNNDEEVLIKLITIRLPAYPGFKELKFYELDNLLQKAEYHLKHGLNIDSSEDYDEEWKGNSNVANSALGLIESPNLTPDHGTHVAGILGAVRNNDKGVNGIADNVKIMTLKVISNIRELRDRDLARAIRYAVDNGALVINMSFGKSYTFDKKAVDEAVKYAMSHDVLIIHGAGNSGIDLDITGNNFYPTRLFENGDSANAWINVGASGLKDDSTLAASFSNYGKKSVDVFAPGVNIYSTTPHSKYASWSGTSMASPVVAGLAVLIREYFPKLSALQVRNIIMRTVVKREILKDKCVSGGVINAYNALKLAASY